MKMLTSSSVSVFISNTPLRYTQSKIFSLVTKLNIYMFLYFADRAFQYIYLNINQFDALNFIMSLFHASTCFEHMCLKHVEA